MTNPIQETHATQNLRVTALAIGMLVLAYAFFAFWHTWVEVKGNIVESLRTITELEARAVDNYFVHIEGDLKSLSNALRMV